MNSPRLRSIGKSETVVNPKGFQVWADLVGRFALNFGSAEFCTYKWIQNLSDQEFEAAIGKPFSARLGILTKLVKSKLKDQKTVKDVLSEIQNLREMAEIRNTILHNPVVIVSKEKDGVKTEFLAIPYLKGIKNGNKTGSLPKSFLAEALLEVKRIVESIDEKLKVSDIAQP